MMKRFGIIAMVAALFAVATPMISQPQPGGRGPGRIERLRHDLKLTDEQARKISAILETADKDMQKRHTASADERHAKQEAIEKQQKGIDDKISALLDDGQKEMFANMQKHRRAMNRHADQIPRRLPASGPGREVLLVPPPGPEIFPDPQDQPDPAELVGHLKNLLGLSDNQSAAIIKLLGSHDPEADEDVRDHGGPAGAPLFMNEELMDSVTVILTKDQAGKFEDLRALLPEPPVSPPPEGEGPSRSRFHR
jgi:Spy/CpxP family protein refolding chaperone